VGAHGELGGSRLLYVGDHVYADIVRSKRSLGWRTCLIVPELTRELALHRRLKKVSIFTNIFYGNYRKSSLPSVASDVKK